MSLTNDIQRILWHEMGHFCVDILKPQHHKDYFVNEFKIIYEKRNDSLIPWRGHVEMLPSIAWNLIPKDSSFMAYSLISLASACIFETIYFTKILKEERELKDCFSLNKKNLGRGDFRHYHEITSQMRKLYPCFRGTDDVNKFMEIDYVDLVKEKIKELQEFHENLAKIINPLAEEIKKEFISKGSMSLYEFEISGKRLDILQKEVEEISTEHGFNDVVEELRGILIEKYVGFIKKYTTEP